jgi:hypothetical protein
MSVASDQFHSRKTPPDQRAQKRCLESAILTRTHVHSQDLPLSRLSLHPNGNHHRSGGYSPVLAVLQIGGIEPDVGVGTF